MHAMILFCTFSREEMLQCKRMIGVVFSFLNKMMQSLSIYLILNDQVLFDAESVSL